MDQPEITIKLDNISPKGRLSLSTENLIQILKTYAYRLTDGGGGEGKSYLKGLLGRHQQVINKLQVCGNGMAEEYLGG